MNCWSTKDSRGCVYKTVLRMKGQEATMLKRNPPSVCSHSAPRSCIVFN